MSQPDISAVVAAVMAAMQGTTDDATDDAPTTTKAKGSAKATAAKTNTLKVPTFTTKDDDGTRWQVTMAHGTAKNPSLYRVPRVVLESMPQGQDTYRRVATFPVGALDVLGAMPEKTGIAMAAYVEANATE